MTTPETTETVEETPEFPRIPKHVRAYIYRVIGALVPVLTFHGILTTTTAGLYVAVLLAVLGIGQAVAYTNTDR